MRRCTRMGLTSAAVALLVGCTSSSDSGDQVPYDADLGLNTSQPVNPVPAPEQVAARPGLVEFEWRDETLVLTDTTDASFDGDSHVVVPGVELGHVGFNGGPGDVAYLVAPPTDQLGTALNERVLGVDRDGDLLRFEVEPVEFGAVFEEVHLDVTQEIPEDDLQTIADDLNAATDSALSDDQEDVEAAYRARVVDGDDIQHVDDDPSPFPDGPDEFDEGLTEDDLPTVQLLNARPDDTQLSLTSTDVRGPMGQAERYEPSRALELAISELDPCPGGDRWREGITIAGDPCGDRLVAEVVVQMSPSVDFYLESRWFGRPRDAVIGANFDTTLKTRVSGEGSWSTCNEDCQTQLERNESTMQQKLDTASDLLDLIGDAADVVAILNNMGIPQVTVQVSWPFSFDADVDGAYSYSVSKFVGAGMLYGDSADGRVEPYVHNPPVTSSSRLRINGHATLTTGPTLEILAGRSLGPTVSLSGTLEGKAQLQRHTLDETWPDDRPWTDAAWNADYSADVHLGLLLQDPFVGKLATDWELLDFNITEATLARSKPSQPRVKATARDGEVHMEWLPVLHADRYVIAASETARGCFDTSNGDASADGQVIDTVDGTEVSFSPEEVDADVWVLCMRAIGKDKDGEPVRSPMSNSVQVDAGPPPAGTDQSSEPQLANQWENPNWPGQEGVSVQFPDGWEPDMFGEIRPDEFRVRREADEFNNDMIRGTSVPGDDIEDARARRERGNDGWQLAFDDTDRPDPTVPDARQSVQVDIRDQMGSTAGRGVLVEYGPGRVYLVHADLTWSEGTEVDELDWPDLKAIAETLVIPDPDVVDWDGTWMTVS